jgi:hypothetical protein
MSYTKQFPTWGAACRVFLTFVREMRDGTDVLPIAIALVGSGSQAHDLIHDFEVRGVIEKSDPLAKSHPHAFASHTVYRFTGNTFGDPLVDAKCAPTPPPAPAPVENEIADTLQKVADAMKDLPDLIRTAVSN